MVKKRDSHLLTFDEAHRLFRYDPETGLLYNRVYRGSKSPKGALSGSPARGGRYFCVCYKGEGYLTHRLVWFMHHGEWPKDQIDHIDRNGLNNRLDNLRECDTSENHQNQDMTNRKGTSRYIGVCKPANRDGWRSQIVIRKKQVYLGSYRCETAAYVAYCKAKANTHLFVVDDRPQRGAA